MARGSSGGENKVSKMVELDEMEGGKEYRVYSVRWIILFLFVLYSTSNAFQVKQTNTITVDVDI